MYGFKILCEILKVLFEISHKILNAYTAKYAFCEVSKVWRNMISQGYDILSFSETGPRRHQTITTTHVDWSSMGYVAFTWDQFPRNTHDMNLQDDLVNYIFKLLPHLSEAIELTSIVHNISIFKTELLFISLFAMSVNFYGRPW